MLNIGMRRSARPVAALIACALITACGGDGAGEVKENEKPKTNVVVADDSLSVVFQLTGLMLVVPPKVSGGDGRTHVMLPRVGSHRARLGFGLRYNIPGLCSTFTKRICYVDLENWDVGTIGAGGAPTDPRNTGIPRGAVNVTRASGGDYKANPSRVKPKLRSHITFAAGKATDSCSLGRWRHTPVNQAGNPTTEETLNLVNVLAWTIRYPGDSFTLRFTPKGLSAPVISVPLEGIGYDRMITVVLAHVEQSELKYLPPADSGSVAGSATSLKHIHDFYNLLRKSDGTEPTPRHRPVPVFAGSTGPERCRVTISTPRDGMLPFIAGGGIKTYGCVVGSGEG
jgi:hypothetical protein